MNNWTAVVTHPLGLAGFALFLIFTYFGKSKGRTTKRWQQPTAVIFAFVALLGGLVLAYVQTSQTTKPAASAEKNDDNSKKNSTATEPVADGTPNIPDTQTNGAQSNGSKLQNPQQSGSTEKQNNKVNDDRQKPIASTTQESKTSTTQSQPNISQSSNGPGSPNIIGSKGNVTITVDQSTGTTKTVIEEDK